MGVLQSVDVGRLPLERFEDVLPAATFERVRAAVAEARELFDGRTIWNVNSTPRGGGVAEMLLPLLAYANGIGVDARWVVIRGDERFFTITKRIHNLLHGAPGDGGPLGDAERADYDATLRPNAEELLSLVGDRDVVILHDPQTAGLVGPLRDRGIPVVWRCHVGLDTPSDLAREAWRFLEPDVAQADVTVFSREAFAWDNLDPARRAIIAPSIDAFAPKNQQLDDGAVAAILRVAGLRAGGGPDDATPSFTRMDGSAGVVERRAELVEDAPLGAEDPYVLQVSRWDALKDPLGVIDGFAAGVDGGAHLVYAGPSVSAVADDPEGGQVLQGAIERWRSLDAGVRARIHLAMLPLDDLEENAAIVNALQRGAAVVVQKSLAEGFGLTVAEAMWKGRPVVASRIGGIQDQIEDGVSGVLLDDPHDLNAYAAALRRLLADRESAAAMGRAASERVREHFLGTHSLLDYLEVLRPLVR